MTEVRCSASLLSCSSLTHTIPMSVQESYKICIPWASLIRMRATYRHSRGSGRTVRSTFENFACWIATTWVCSVGPSNTPRVSAAATPIYYVRSTARAAPNGLLGPCGSSYGRIYGIILAVSQSHAYSLNVERGVFFLFQCSPLLRVPARTKLLFDSIEGRWEYGLEAPIIPNSSFFRGLLCRLGHVLLE